MKLIKRDPNGGPATMDALSLAELNVTAMQDGSLHAVLPLDSSFLRTFNDEQVEGLSGRDIRLDLSIEAEQKRSGQIRILFRSQATQAREPISSSCCCDTNEKGDEVVTIHTVLTIPPKVVDKMRRGLINGVPAIMTGAVSGLRALTGFGYNGNSVTDQVIARAVTEAKGTASPVVLSLAPGEYVSSRDVE